MSTSASGSSNILSDAEKQELKQIISEDKEAINALKNDLDELEEILVLLHGIHESGTTIREMGDGDADLEEFWEILETQLKTDLKMTKGITAKLGEVGSRIENLQGAKWQFEEVLMPACQAHALTERAMGGLRKVFQELGGEYERPLNRILEGSQQVDTNIDDLKQLVMNIEKNLETVNEVAEDIRNRLEKICLEEGVHGREELEDQMRKWEREVLEEGEGNRWLFS